MRIPRKGEWFPRVVDPENEEPQDVVSKFNAPFFLELSDALSLVKTNEVFKDLPTSDGLQLPKSDTDTKTDVATGAGMDAGSYGKSMKVNGEFSARGNLFLADLMSQPTKKVPIYRKVIRDLQDQFFSEPTSHLPSEITLAVRSDQSVGGQKWGPGCASLISCPEIPWAYILSIAEFIKKGATPLELEPFRQGLLSAPLRFVVIDNEKERYWKHHQIREDVTQLGHSLKRTPLGRGHDIMEEKAMLNADIGAAACAKAWSDNVKLSKASEPIKPAFVDATFTVWKRIMDIPELAEQTLRFEADLPVSPWDSMYKLEVVISYKYLIYPAKCFRTYQQPMSLC